MKTIIIFFIIIINTLSVAQINAITENGDTVLLKNDGTWEFKTEYSELDSNSEFTVDTNYTPFFKSDLARKVVKGQNVNYELWYDSNKWELTNTASNPSAEYIFKYKHGEAYCMIIP